MNVSRSRIVEILFLTLFVLVPPKAISSPDAKNSDINLVCQVRSTGVVFGNVDVAPGITSFEIRIRLPKNTAGATATTSGAMHFGNRPEELFRVEIGQGTIQMTNIIDRSMWDWLLLQSGELVDVTNNVVVNRVTGSISYVSEGRFKGQGDFMIGYAGNCEKVSAGNKKF